VEQGAELPEGDGVLGVGSIKEEWSAWGLRLLNGAWIGRLHSPTALSRSSGLLDTRPLD